MAEAPGPKVTVITLLCLLLTLFPSVLTSQPFSRNISPTSMGLKKEKLTHLHFFLHDIVTAREPTAVIVAEAPTSNASSTGFGELLIIDDPLTEGPDRSSKLVGKAQGLYAHASQADLSFLLAITFAFTQGKFNGSTLSLLGRDQVLSPVRDMPIVGGSGVFRFARGYTLSTIHSLDVIAKNAVVEFNVYVFHY